MKRSQVLRILTLVVPPLCFVVAAYVGYGQYSRLQSLEAERTRTRQNLEFVRQTIAEVAAEPSISKIAAVSPSADEQALFLDSLRILAAQSNVELVRWSTMPPVIEKAQDPSTGQSPNEQGPIALPSIVELRGTFTNLRNFVYGITRAYRLLNISNVYWERSDDLERTTLRFSLTRFVTTTPGPSPTDPAQEKALP